MRRPRGCGVRRWSGVRCEAVVGAQVSVFVDMLAAARSEISFMHTIPPHRNITRYVASSTHEDPGGRDITFYILMEYCGGVRLSDEKRKRPSEREVVTIMTHVLDAVDHMHSLKPPVAHRDIKLDNVLDDGHGT